MAGQIDILTTTFTAAATMTIVKYDAVVQTANDYECGHAAAVATGKFLGIAQEPANAGDSVPVRMLGTSTVRAVGAITVGDALVVMTDGTVDTIANHAGGVVIGQALSHAAAAGDYILAMIGLNNK
jgi:hypothetical protein